MDFIIGFSIVLFILTLMLLVPYGRRIAHRSRTGKTKAHTDKPANDGASNARIAAGGKKALEQLLKAPSTPPPQWDSGDAGASDHSIDRDFRERGIVHLEEVRFDGRSANLRPESLPILDEMANVLNKEPESRIQVQGSSNGNIGLAERRARSVVRYLISRGVAEHRLTSTGIVANAGRLRIPPEQIMRNRRVSVSRLD